jgi:AcrR family transcriptional regulator
MRTAALQAGTPAVDWPLTARRSARAPHVRKTKCAAADRVWTRVTAEEGRPEGERPARQKSVDGVLAPRQRILEALIQTAAREGYKRTCVEHVMRVAEVTEPIFQEHFEDKQDLFVQASDQLIGRIELAVLRSVYSDAPWPRRIRRGLQTLLTTVAEHPDCARVVMIECPQAGDRALERLLEAEAVFAPVLEEGRAYAASVSHLSDVTSPGVVGGIVAIVHRRVLEGHSAELPTLLADLLHFALTPYLGQSLALTAADAAR